MIADARPNPPPFAPGTRPQPASLARDRRRRALRAQGNAYVRALAHATQDAPHGPTPPATQGDREREELFFDWSR